MYVCIILMYRFFRRKLFKQNIEESHIVLKTRLAMIRWYPAFVVQNTCINKQVLKELNLSRMAMYDKSDMKGGMMDDAAPIHRIRITLTSSNVKSLEKGRSCADFLKFVNLIASFRKGLLIHLSTDSN